MGIQKYPPLAVCPLLRSEPLWSLKESDPGIRNEGRESIGILGKFDYFAIFPARFEIQGLEDFFLPAVESSYEKVCMTILTKLFSFFLTMSTKYLPFLQGIRNFLGA